MNVAANVTELIGNTPLVTLNHFSNNTTKVIGKCEFRRNEKNEWMNYRFLLY